MSARPTRTPSQEGQDKTPVAAADGTMVAAGATEDVVDVHIPITLTRAGQYRLTVEIRNTDGQAHSLSPPVFLLARLCFQPAALPQYPGMLLSAGQWKCMCRQAVSVHETHAL